jgi:hypothetical protein
MLTGNPVGSVIAHGTAHVTAVLHQYYGGGQGFLPPGLTPGSPSGTRGAAGAPVSAGWLALMAAVVALGRNRIVH